MSCVVIFTVVWFWVSWISVLRVSFLVSDMFVCRAVCGVFKNSVILCVWSVSVSLHRSCPVAFLLLGGIGLYG